MRTSPSSLLLSPSFTYFCGLIAFFLLFVGDAASGRHTDGAHLLPIATKSTSQQAKFGVSNESIRQLTELFVAFFHLAAVMASASCMALRSLLLPSPPPRTAGSHRNPAGGALTCRTGADPKVAFRPRGEVRWHGGVGHTAVGLLLAAARVDAHGGSSRGP